ncbi:MAG: hypothetical protein A2W73_07790 [Deltaproteobacteria bacterium RIFCSPLOWO2_12_55_13]|nr:MAG: hypothetical protein A2W73_07790 [Deltaproteobacteria bacterium RIFCSPLOWO2_12_55_13]HBA38735.1 hypothetical protein [Deltaproteobacteria bacterium]
MYRKKDDRRVQGSVKASRVVQISTCSERIKSKIVFVCSEENFINLFISHCKKKIQKNFFPKGNDLDTCRIEC